MKPSYTTTLKDKVPIWLVDWHFKDKHGSIRIQERIIMKFHKGEDVMNNHLLSDLNRKESKEKGKPKLKNNEEKNHALKQNEGEGLEAESELDEAEQ